MSTCTYQIRGNHPMFARVDEEATEENETQTVTAYLRGLGYEVTVQRTDLESTEVTDVTEYFS